MLICDVALLYISESTAITNLTVTSTTDVSVTISWMDPALYESMITEYLITATSKDHNRTITHREDDNSVTIDSIVPGTAYDISVSAVYMNGFISSPDSVSVMLSECEG